MTDNVMKQLVSMPFEELVRRKTEWYNQGYEAGRNDTYQTCIKLCNENEALNGNALADKIREKSNLLGG